VPVSRLCTIVCGLLPFIGAAQFQTLDPLRFGSFYMRSTFQSQQHLTDSAGNFQQGSVSVGFVLPILHKVWQSEHTPSSLVIQLNPAVNYTRLLSNGIERMLHNPQLTASSFYSFLNTNRIAINIRGQFNEDEFTKTYPKLLANGTAYYSRTLGQNVRLHAGAGYSFIYGDARWYPIVGADISLGSASHLILLYPLLASYQITPNERFKLSFFAKPTGLLSFIENRLNIPDTNRQTLVFGVQSLSTGVDVSWLIAPPLTLVLSPAYSPTQTTKLQNRDASVSYSSYTLSDAFIFYAQLVWRPWQQSKRNTKQQPYHFKNDNDIIIPF